MKAGKWGEWLARLVLAGVFVFAGGTKLLAPQAFADSLYSYRLIPVNLINPLAAGVPILEILLGVMLIGGIAMRVCSQMTIVLYVVFIAVLGQAVIRGIPVDCGCFGASAADGGKALMAIGRDMVLLGAALFLLRQYPVGNMPSARNASR